MQDTVRRMCYSSVYDHEKDPSKICVELLDDAIIAEFDGSMFEKEKTPPKPPKEGVWSVIFKNVVVKFHRAMKPIQ